MESVTRNFETRLFLLGRSAVLDSNLMEQLWTFQIKTKSEQQLFPDKFSMTQ